MMQQHTWPLVSFDLIDNAIADRLLIEWGHYLGACRRPFGRQSFGLHMEGGGLVSVAVSASTVAASCAGYARPECVELARLCSHPAHAWATRVCLRLWREIGARQWPHWQLLGLVSYSNNVRHAGSVYRLDGWERWGTVKGSTGGGSWSNEQLREDKTIWHYPLPTMLPAPEGNA